MYSITTKNSVSIILENKERVTALRAKITLQKDEIVSIAWHESFQSWSDFMVRMPGSYLPNWIIAGSYWTTEGWDFIYALQPKGLTKPLVQNVLVIESTKDKYRRVIIRLPKKYVSEIIAWWKDK